MRQSVERAKDKHNVACENNSRLPRPVGVCVCVSKEACARTPKRAKDTRAVEMSEKQSRYSYNYLIHAQRRCLPVAFLSFPVCLPACLALTWNVPSRALCLLFNPLGVGRPSISLLWWWCIGCVCV